ncbi:hypothetical protein JXA85_07700 [Candidatus Woesearchaeota archaeon]|nr:hypothetical protein [Candidatus Woesearchaeota archaeon]
MKRTKNCRCLGAPKFFKFRGKGIFFTIISLFVVTLIYFFVMTDSMGDVRYSSRAAGGVAAKERILSTNDYVTSLKADYVERALRTGSYNALLSMVTYMNKTHSFISGVQGNFTEVLLNGTIEGTPLADMEIYFMENKTLPVKIEEIQAASMEFLRINASLLIKGINLEQNAESGPFRVAVALNLSVYVDSGVASWNDTYTIISYTEIDGISDPFYFMFTPENYSGNINYSNSFKKTNISEWNLNGTKSLILERGYKYEEKAPSFLNRLQGSFSASGCCGIESLIYFNSTKNMSFADYCYFSERCQGSNPKANFSLYNITNITTDVYRFKLEPYHIGTTKYDLFNFSIKNNNS